jgi:hypothetical protein
MKKYRVDDAEYGRVQANPKPERQRDEASHELMGKSPSDGVHDVGIQSAHVQVST